MLASLVMFLIYVIVICVIAAIVLWAVQRFFPEVYPPARLIVGAVALIGNQEANEIEAALYRPAQTWRGLFGNVINTDEEFAPKLPYPLTEAVTLFGVKVERVDQPSLIGVIAEDVEG